MPKLFVVMPFGTRAAERTHDITAINFDTVYTQLVKPAAECLGWMARRIDEVTAPGAIEHQYLREIFEADLMLADVSLPNGNVFYELGLRQAISNGGTILIACQGSALPFDIASQRVLFYELSDNGLQAARPSLESAIASHQSASNPVRVFLEQLGLAVNPSVDAGRFQQDLNARIERAITMDQLEAVWQWAKRYSPLPVSSLLLLARRVADRAAGTLL